MVLRKLGLGMVLLAGVLSVGNNAALGSASTNLNGGTLQASTAVSLANLITVGGANTVAGSNNLTFTGPVTLSSGSTLTVAEGGV